MGVFLRRGEDRFHPADNLRVIIALVPSLVAGFLVLLPVVLHRIGLRSATTWLLVASVYAVVVAFLGTMIIRRIQRLPGEAGELISARITLVSTLLAALAIIAMVLNATTSLLRPSRGGFYFFGILVLLWVSANAFVRMPFVRPAD